MEAFDFACLKEEQYEEINRTIQREVESADAQRNWIPSYSASYIESSNDLLLAPEYLEPRLQFFRSMILASGGPLRWPDCASFRHHSWFSMDPFKHLVRARLELTRIRKIYLATLRKLSAPWPVFEEDMIGTPYHSRRFLLFGKPITEANLAHSFYYGLIERFAAIEGANSVLEIGGGFGGLLGRIALRHPNKALYITELPRATLLSYFYLRTKLGKASLLYSPERMNQPRERASVLFPWMLDRLDINVDLAINTVSFQHMNAANHEFYFRNLRRLNAKQVFSLNRTSPYKRGESPYLDVAKRHGYSVETDVDVSPWHSGIHLTILTLAR